MSRKTEKTHYKKKRDQRRKTNVTQKRKDRRTYEDRQSFERFFKYSKEPMKRTDKRRTDKRYKKRTEKYY
jgi:hypothetical protein